MRSDKDEIARLKLEVLALQKKMPQEKPVPVVALAKAPEVDIGRLKSELAAAEITIKNQAISISKNAEEHLIAIEKIESLKADLAESKKEIDRITLEKDSKISDVLKDFASASAERDLIAEKIECINMLKIKNSELEVQVLALSERLKKAEAMKYGYQ